MTGLQGTTRQRRAVRALLGGSVVALLVFTALLFRENRDLKDAAAQGPPSAKQESRRVTDKVAQLMQLPSNETATVATVRNKNRLKRQRFFRNAENGDKVLIFTKAKRVVVYREQENRIVNVGPVVVGTGPTSSGTAKRKRTASKSASRGATAP